MKQGSRLQRLAPTQPPYTHTAPALKSSSHAALAPGRSCTLGQRKSLAEQRSATSQTFSRVVRCPSSTPCLPLAGASLLAWKDELRYEGRCKAEQPSSLPWIDGEEGQWSTWWRIPNPAPQKSESFPRQTGARYKG